MKDSSLIKNRWRDLGVTMVILVSALAAHLVRLGTFPIFADEAIYIRWAQLFLDEPARYAFFSLNDGKTPIFIWLLAPLQFLFNDQLVAARSLSVMVGLLQALAMTWLIKALGGKRLAQTFGLLFSLWLPFWFTYYHLALMDGLLTLLLTLAFTATIKASQLVAKKQLLTAQSVSWMVVGGLAYGASLWTKLPALFFAPSFLVIPFGSKTGFDVRKRQFQAIIAMIGLGLVLFASMKIVPGFGQLFRRGQDFAATEFGVAVVVSRFIHFSAFAFKVFVVYLNPVVVLLAVAGLFSNSLRRTIGLLLGASILFVLPFTIAGQVVHSRYLLPAAIGITAAAALSLEAAYSKWLAHPPNLRSRMIAAFVYVSLLSLVLNSVLSFTYMFVFSPDQTPFLAEDREQYLEEWSSGHGIRETVALIRQAAQTKTVAVATEGRFGSLPDGLLVYFHDRDVSHIYIEGTGQYPVKSLPPEFIARAKDFDQVLLVVNSHRLQMALAENQKLAEFCRPNHAPCLQVWDVTSLVQTAP